MATITLEVPDELAARLRERAEAEDTTVEALLERSAEREAPGPLPLIVPSPEATEFFMRLKNRTPEELEADRARILSRSPVPRPLPPGMTLADVIRGKWPGDETDEEIEEALRRMS